MGRFFCGFSDFLFLNGFLYCRRWIWSRWSEFSRRVSVAKFSLGLGVFSRRVVVVVVVVVADLSSF